MTILATNFNALASINNCSLESWWTMLTRAAMEMNSHEVDTHSLNLFHPFGDFLFSINVITEFAWKLSRQMIALFLLYGNPPQNSHVGGILKNLVKLVNCVSSCQWNSMFWSPLKFFLLLNGIWVNKILWSNSEVHKLLKLTFGSTIKVGANFDQIQ